jgi:hypothetical protein
MKNISKIALFLDIDGVLNQYNIDSRKYKLKKHQDYNMKPYKKKILKLTKLIKRYNIHVYIFSAWRQKELEEYLPFKIYGDTRKWAENVIEISKEYKHNLIIDDEIQYKTRIFGHERIPLPENIILHKPYYEFGLINKDFRKLEHILENLIKL